MFSPPTPCLPSAPPSRPAPAEPVVKGMELAYSQATQRAPHPACVLCGLWPTPSFSVPYLQTGNRGPFLGWGVHDGCLAPGLGGAAGLR